jgi:hypothetical protein
LVLLQEAHFELSAGHAQPHCCAWQSFALHLLADIAAGNAVQDFW